jgi:hypothetical protein
VKEQPSKEISIHLVFLLIFFNTQMLSANKASFTHLETKSTGPVSGSNGRLSSPSFSSSTPSTLSMGIRKLYQTGPICCWSSGRILVCDEGSLEDPLIFWEMTRHLWPHCVKFPLLYLSYMPWTIYLESEGIFTIQTTSQAVKEIYSE